jgi:hypothetical protein
MRPKESLVVDHTQCSFERILYAPADARIVVVEQEMETGRLKRKI